MEKSMEIFAVGKWNGMDFTVADLNMIVTAFKMLGDNHKVPLKFGHNNEQAMTDGMPALGWVSGLRVAGDKLIADVTGIPDIVMSAMEKKLYRNVSVELDMDVTYKDQHYPIVLSGIALLGADIPAVNTLKDLTHYLGRDAAFSVGRQAMFSAIAGNKQGESNMELKELADKVEKLSADVGKLSGENATLKSENTGLTARLATFTAEKVAAEATAAKSAADTKRADINAIFEEGIKAELITPAQRGQFTKLLKLDDDKALDTIVVEDVKALVTGGKKFDFGRMAQGRQGEDSGDDSRSPDVILAEKMQELVDKKEAPDLFSAQIIVFRRNPDLAKAWANGNGERRSA